MFWDEFSGLVYASSRSLIEGGVEGSYGWAGGFWLKCRSVGRDAQELISWPKNESYDLFSHRFPRAGTGIWTLNEVIRLLSSPAFGVYGDFC